MKLSILFLYLRMTPERSHKIAIYVIMGFVVAHEIVSLVVRRSFPRSFASCSEYLHLPRARFSNAYQSTNSGLLGIHFRVENALTSSRLMASTARGAL